MGRIGNSTKRVPNTGGIFVKFQDGDKIRFRLLEEPWVRVTQYGSDEPQYAYLFPVWDYVAGKPRILSQGVAGANEIDDMNDEWGEEYPSKFDLTIKATGSGKNGRKYTRTSSPHQGTMPSTREFEMIDMATVADGAVTLAEHEAGKDPELQVRESTDAPTSEPKRPTHADAEALAQERVADSDDVVIQDLDPSKEVNMDDIPF